MPAKSVIDTHEPLRNMLSQGFFYFLLYFGRGFAALWTPYSPA